MARIRIDYTARAGLSKSVDFTTTQPLANALEDIGKVMVTGSLYIVQDGDQTCCVPGRRIEAVEVLEA